MDNRTTNDLLLQLLEGQSNLLEKFSEHKGEVNARVNALETTNKRQWYIHAAQATILACFGAARKFGIL